MNAHSTLWGYPNDSPRGNAMWKTSYPAPIFTSLMLKMQAQPFDNAMLKTGLTSRFHLANIFRIQHPGKFLKMLASVTIILSKLTLRCNVTYILGLKRPMGVTMNPFKTLNPQSIPSNKKLTSLTQKKILTRRPRTFKRQFSRLVNVLTRQKSKKEF
ncbi:hypothetical protein AVEN_219365-1 [Araneus ventricosus]|uniref:Uncharacterized protein n=1 Tax=Araneus ventricosus TaxID=182803 RepID=A0A4Y2BEJ7_ARAVE|nr:hypothetical protein AVEN_219365-1 [Araneus ventricosus]